MECEGVLEIGTEVSAKYKGAFCEAVIKSVEASLEARLEFTVKGKGSHWVHGKNIRGQVRLHGLVEAQHPSDGQYYQGTIVRITDNSIYTVVFDDGDVRTVKRQGIHLKPPRPDSATPAKSGGRVVTEAVPSPRRHTASDINPASHAKKPPPPSPKPPKLSKPPSTAPAKSDLQ
eukprot:comp23226_c1_seq1/m.37871 comp23226_c1_seq1/g.37871  ORF comp23226_c1_seq1/g.37871 comp23226_c1_seq1/m.37871 type:complete len:174 (-) comp23226_c1_seq1:4-525(-)